MIKLDFNVSNNHAKIVRKLLDNNRIPYLRSKIHSSRTMFTITCDNPFVFSSFFNELMSHNFKINDFIIHISKKLK